MSKDIGIDLGTANTLIYMKGKGIIMNEPTVVAIDKTTDSVRYVGSEAKEIIGRSPKNIVACCPLKDGTIADFDITASMLEIFIHKALGSLFFSRPHVVICIPAGVNTVERKAVREVAQKAGGKQVYIIEEPLAAAIGAGLPVREACGSFVCDIGGGTTEVGVVSLGSCVISRSNKIAGNYMDQAIIQYLKNEFQLLIGERTAEDIKIKIGSALPYEGEEPIEIKGRNLVDSFPQTLLLSPAKIREALAGSIESILETIRGALECTPPELSSDIMDQGITLTGGGALLRNLDKRITMETGIKVTIAQNPLDCVAVGTGLVVEQISSYGHITNENIKRY